MDPSIYQIKNKINEKFYLGGSIETKDRWSKHKSLLRRNEHTNPYLQKDWNKFGEKCFEFFTLEELQPLECRIATREKVLKLEQKYLDKLQPYRKSIGYNISKTADGSAVFGIHNSMYKDEVLSFFDFYTHKELKKTRVEMKKYFKTRHQKGLKGCALAKLIKGKVLSVHNLCLSRDLKENLNSTRNKLFCCQNEDKGIFYIGRLEQFWKSQDLNARSAADLVSPKRKLKKYKGWILMSDNHYEIIFFLQRKGFDDFSAFYKEGVIIYPEESLYKELNQTFNNQQLVAPKA